MVAFTPLPTATKIMLRGYRRLIVIFSSHEALTRETTAVS